VLSICWQREDYSGTVRRLDAQFEKSDFAREFVSITPKSPNGPLRAGCDCGWQLFLVKLYGVIDVNVRNAAITDPEWYPTCGNRKKYRQWVDVDRVVFRLYTVQETPVSNPIQYHLAAACSLLQDIRWGR
jgi:hypothetical protein